VCFVENHLLNDIFFVSVNPSNVIKLADQLFERSTINDNYVLNQLDAGHSIECKHKQSNTVSDTYMYAKSHNLQHKSNQC